MQITVTVRHGQLHPDTQRLLQEKAAKLVQSFDRLTQIAVLVDLQNPANKLVEVLASADHAHDFIAHDRQPDLMAALASAVEKLHHQLTRYKEKTQDHRRDPHTGGAARPAAPVPAAD